MAGGSALVYLDLTAGAIGLGNITAVTFDLWQTLLLDRPEVGRIRTQARLDGTRSALIKVGERHTLERVEEAYRNCVRQCQENRRQLLDISFHEQVELFVNGISPELVARLPESTFQQILSAYGDSFFAYPPSPHPDGVQVLRSLRDMGLGIGLISNTAMTPGVAFRRFLAEHGLLEYFDALTFSDEVRIAKPSCEIFHLTLRQLNATPPQAVHVGDQVLTDIAGAKECGLKTVWIEGFYERPDLNDPKTEPDIAVRELSLTVSAIRALAGDLPPNS